MRVMNRPRHHKYNCLFLPGLPGRVKEFNFFDDITNTGGKIHWLQYSGTYDNKDGVDFTINSSLQDIDDALEKLSRDNLPIIIVAYSYSTFLLDKVDFSKYNLISGMAAFSPIRGLDRHCIGEDFNSTIEELVATGDIVADVASWNSVMRSRGCNYENFLEEVCKHDFPVMIAYSLADKVIRADQVSSDINNFRQKHTYNKILVFEQNIGYHRLDSYYDLKIGNFFRALEIEIDLTEILNDDIFVYLWGSSLNYNYSGEGSDIDLLVFHDGYLNKYKELNSYIEKYNRTHDINLDLSINNKTDLLSKKIFRYNRGPVAIHELRYAYFPLKPASQTIDLNWDDVVKDAYGASLILAGESKKILSKCDIHNERVKKIIKYSITVFTYLQYIKGVKNLDLNNVEKYLDRSYPFYENIKRSLELKRSNYKGMTIDDLFEAVNGIDMIILEQERTAGVLL